MRIIDRETTPVEYSLAATRVLFFSHPADSSCFRFHWHERVEIIRVVKGDMTVDCGGSPLKVKEGELVIFSPRTPHRGVAGKKGVEYCVLMFDVRSFYNDTPVCKDILPAIFEGRATFTPLIRDKATIQCCDGICYAESQDSLEVTGKLYSLLYLLTSRHLASFKKQVNNSVKEITDYIEAHFAENLTTASLCKRFGYTDAHFCRKFKEATGLTPVTYVKIFRLECACKRIKEGEGNIGKVAAECGFADANYFARCFKAHFGVAPTYYKKYA